MKNPSNRISINGKNIKVIAIFLKEGWHKEICFDYRTIQDYESKGWAIYATNDEGVFFFLNNRNDDGFDWCKITKDNRLHLSTQEGGV